MKTWKTWKTGVGVSMAITALFAAAPACSSSSSKGGSGSGGGGGAGTTTSSASWSCSAKGPCANDPAPTASQISDCQDSLNDPMCGSSFKAQAVCAFENPDCDSAGMSGASPSCKSADVAWANCMLGDAGTD